MSLEAFVFMTLGITVGLLWLFGIEGRTDLSDALPFMVFTGVVGTGLLWVEWAGFIRKPREK